METRQRDSGMTDDYSNLPVHPAAAAFRMMTDAELAELAADIEANGLVYPIVLGNWEEDGNGWQHGIIDGRNRQRACEIAGVEPHYSEFQGADPRSFIVSANIHRRDLSKGQKALALALIYPEGAKLRRKGSGSLDPKEHDLSGGLVSQARTIIEFAIEDLAEDVKNGLMHFEPACKEALARKQAKEWRGDGLRKLRQVAPDLAERVQSDRLSLEEARTLFNERENAAREVRASVFSDLRDFLRHGEGFAKGQRFRELPDWLEMDEYRDEFNRYFKGGISELIERAAALNHAATAVNQVAERLNAKKRGRK
jgi:ParB-like nuclease domain